MCGVPGVEQVNNMWVVGLVPVGLLLYCLYGICVQFIHKKMDVVAFSARMLSVLSFLWAVFAFTFIGMEAEAIPFWILLTEQLGVGAAVFAMSLLYFPKSRIRRDMAINPSLLRQRGRAGCATITLWVLLNSITYWFWPLVLGPCEDRELRCFAWTPVIGDRTSSFTFHFYFAFLGGYVIFAALLFLGDYIKQRRLQ